MTMRKARWIFPVMLLLLGSPAWSSPSSSPPHSAHSKFLELVRRQMFSTDRGNLFFTKATFRLLAKKEDPSASASFHHAKVSTGMPDNLFDNLGDGLVMPSRRGAGTDLLLQKNANLPLTRKLLLESGYVDFESSGPKSFQDLHDDVRVLKSSVLGIAYSLTSRLTLSGNYAFIKPEGSDPKLTPLLKATYRLNTSTSVSLLYRQNQDENSLSPDSEEARPTSAKLQIHF